MMHAAFLRSTQQFGKECGSQTRNSTSYPAVDCCIHCACTAAKETEIDVVHSVKTVDLFDSFNSPVKLRMAD